MVLGLRTKHKKGSSVQVGYQIHIQEIKPWPPSQSLKSVRSVILQWENGDRNSGSINPVAPSVGSGVGDGKIEFNESFRLTVMLSRDASVKSRNAEIYLKNCIEFNLYEPRRDKTVKGQLLGTVVIDLAEYGPIGETIIVTAPMNCKRSFKNTAQPVLSIKIQPFEKLISSSSSRESLFREASLDTDAEGSVSALMNGEYAEEAEIASFSDDGVSSQSSITNSSSAFEATGSSSPQNEENALESVKDGKGTSTHEPSLSLEQVAVKSSDEPVIAAGKHLNGSSSPSPSIELFSEVGSPENDQASMPNFHNRNSTSIIRKNVNHSDQFSSSSLANEGTKDENMNNSEPMSVNGRSNIQVRAQPADENNFENLLPEAAAPDTTHQVVDSHRVIGKKLGENDQRLSADKGHNTAQNEISNGFSPDAIRPSGISTSDIPPFSSRRGLRVNGNTPTTSRLRYAKSVRSPSDSPKSNGFDGDNQSSGEVKTLEIPDKAREGTLSFTRDEGKDATTVPREARTNSSDSIIQQLKHRIKKLQGELRETAAMELSLYSVVAEHGSSVNKVHAPARRLSRLYLHASKNPSQVSRASVAKSIVSGLLLVAKAGGNDVPRLTFWLSNSVVLRGIISLTLEDSQLPVSAGPHVETIDTANGNTNRFSSTLKWKKSPSIKKENNLGSSDDWEDSCTFTAALEKIETWIFSRIVESIWWQTLTPYMQPAPGKSREMRRVSSSIRGSYERQSSLSAQEQVNFSLDLWKKAFKDARERLCPVRASGHECGCLPLLARLVMEQSVARLDVAMFNAILRESVDEVPMDPVSDPISDSDVLPIPAGKSSFGAGAQLKNAIGNWSRWLSDLFGLDDDDHHHDDEESEFGSREESEKSFRLLNAFSNLLMLPKDMLMDRAIRREVCSTFDAPMIRRILQNFVPDEFCPEPVPNDVFDTLNAECQELIECEDEFIENFPLNATPITYQPPSADSLLDIIGEVGKETQLRRSGLSVVRKAYTSDDELDELDSPLNSIIFENSQSSSAQKWMTTTEYGVQQVSRYQLLREVWKEAD
ncbi:hypothetical protein MKX03_026717 [Papaver bracteatum]|nr:hypothetical protein MKX03_026717 [Papaver bracteatum]